MVAHRSGELTPASGASSLVPVGVAAGFILIAVVVFVTGVPPVCDYPNHLARYWLLSGGASIAPVSRMYAVDWRNASSVGVDFFAALAAQALPYTLVGKLILTVALIAPPAGAACLNRIVFGRGHWWQLVFVALAWTTTALYGFINYQVSLGAALLFACLDGFLPSGAVLKTLIRMAFAGMVVWLHPIGLILYAALLTAFVIGKSWRGIFNPDRLQSIVKAELSPLLVFVVPLVLLFVLSPAPPGDHIGNGISLPNFRPHFRVLVEPFLSYDYWLDLIFAVPPLAIYALSVVTGRARSHAGLLIVGIAVAVLALFIPSQMGDAANMHRRLPLMAVLLVFAGILPDLFPARATGLVVAVLIALATARSLWIAHVWQIRQQDVVAVEAAIANVPAGSSMFLVQSEPRDVGSAPAGRYLAVVPRNPGETMIRHVPALVVPQRHAFIASLFATPGQHPIKVLPPFASMSATIPVAQVHGLDGHPTAVGLPNIPDVHVLDGPPAAVGESYLRDWDKHFDYVLAIGMDGEDLNGPFEPPPQLQVVSDQGYARLYRVVR